MRECDVGHAASREIVLWLTLWLLAISRINSPSATRRAVCAVGLSFNRWCHGDSGGEAASKLPDQIIPTTGRWRTCSLGYPAVPDAAPLLQLCACRSVDGTRRADRGKRVVRQLNYGDSALMECTPGMRR
jgi:hypothetical protein